MRIIEFDALEEQVVTRDDVLGRQFNRAVMSRETTGSETLVADVVRFPSGFNHQLHRHPDGDQLAVVLEGSIVAYTRAEERVVHAGGAVLFKAGEWHGVRVDDDEATILNLFPGVGSVPEAGYEASDPSVGRPASRSAGEGDNNL